MIHVLCKAADGRDMEVSKFVEHKHKHGLSLAVIRPFWGGKMGRKKTERIPTWSELQLRRPRWGGKI